MNKRTKNILFALLLIVLAACLVMWKLNVFNLPTAFVGVSTWGLIIAVFMVIIVFFSIVDLFFAGIFFPIAVVCIVFAKPLGIEAITPGIVLIAALLLTIAFEIIFPRHLRHFKKARLHGSFAASGGPSEVIDENKNGHVIHSVRFGSGTKYVRLQNLASADLATQFGEMSVYFDGAHVPSNKVTINCQVSFGELDLYIPKDWNVLNKASVALGHCDDRNNNSAAAVNAVECVIQGSVSFGELKIIRT